MRKLIYTTIFITLLSSFLIAQSQPAKSNSFAEVKSGDEKFDRIFREAREAMDKEDWKKAIEKFSQIACDCPENKQVDAALYWMAYCYKKQKMFEDAEIKIAALMQKFPASNWVDDARILRLEINRGWAEQSRLEIANATALNQAKPPIASSSQGSGVVMTTEPLVFGNNIAQATKLDRDTEFKLAAFQSLLVSDPDRAFDSVEKILQPGSTASEVLKREILRSLRNYHNQLRWRSSLNFNTRITGQTPASTRVSQAEEENRQRFQTLVTSLRDLYIMGLQKETNSEIRVELVKSIASFNDEPAINYLAQFYPTESNKDLKKAIINAFGGVTYTVAGLSGSYEIFESYNQAAEARVATTGQAFPGTNATAKTNPVRELRFAKLMEIFRAEKDLELKRTAFTNLQRFAGWSNRDGMVDLLSQMFDSETDETFKVSIINSFSNLSKNTQATNKLLTIAKSDKSDKMRLEAIRALRNNNSPEVVRFLEDLLK